MTQNAASLRADMYQLLVVGFLHPDRKLAAGLVNEGFQADVAVTAKEIIETLHSDSAAAIAFCAASDALADESLTSDPESLYHELAVEYAHLFIGPPLPAVSPYESAHVDSEPGAPALLVVSPSARAVLAAYREAGLNMAEGLNEPPDHIATEFEFMYYLCSAEARAWAEGNTDEADRLRGLEESFISGHLMKWGEDFALRVEEVSTQPFYRALAAVTQAFLRLEAELKA